MKFVNRIITGRLAEMRHRRNRRIFTLGLFVGGAIVVMGSKLCGKIKCKKCVKRILAERK